MSCAELVSVLFFHEMRFDPRDPSGKDADIFVLSKGHAAPILWAVLKEAGGIQVRNPVLGGIFNMGGAAVANYVSVLERIK